MDCSPRDLPRGWRCEMTAPERFLTTREYAELRRISPQTARLERMRGNGPPFLRTGEPRTGRVLYALSDVEAWLAARRYRSTAEETRALERAAREEGGADVV